MKLDYLKDRKELVSIALLWFSAFLGVVILVKVTTFFVASARAERLVSDAVAQSKADPNDMDKYFARFRAIGDQLKEKNLFAPPKPKQHPVSKVFAILGDEALINGKWYKVGDKVGDAKIIAIGPTQVKVEWQDKEKMFSPFDIKSAPGPGSTKQAKADTKKKPGDKAEKQHGKKRGKPGRGLRNLSPEERAERRDRFRNMSEEERREFIAKRQGSD